MPSNPFSGRFSGGALSNSGEPTAPSSVASAAIALFSVVLRQRRSGLMNRHAADQAFG